MNISALTALQQLVASSTHIIARSVALTLPATTVVLYRGVFTVVTFLLWISVQGKLKSIWSISPHHWWRFAVLGLINMPINQYLFVSGLRLTTAPNAALAFALSPVFVLIFAWLLLGEPLRWQKILGIALAALGAGIVVAERGITLSSQALQGNLMELSASCAWALYTVWGRPLVQQYGALPTTAIGMLSGLVLFLPLAAFVPSGIIEPASLSMQQWGEIAYLGIVTSGLGWTLWYALLHRMEAGRLAVFNNLQPAMTVILSWIAFGDLPSIQFWIGGSIAIAGVILTQRT